MNKRRAPHSLGARHAIERLKKELEALYVRADPRNIVDPELASDLGQYLCLRVSGFLEQAVELVFRDYCAKNSWGPVQDFANSWLDRMPNLSADPLVKMVNRFSSSWAGELESYLLVEERRSKLNALVGIRNAVAHGRQQGLSRERAWDYYEMVSDLVDWLLDRFASEVANTPS